MPAQGGGARLGKLSFENRTASKLELSAPYTGSDQKHSTAKASQDVRPDRLVLYKTIQRDRPEPRTFTVDLRKTSNFFPPAQPGCLFV